MNVFLLSDVHTEFLSLVNKTLKITAPKNTDVVVLAGDIGVGINGLRWARNNFKDLPIVYVAGNHEFYNHDISNIDLFKKKAKQLDIYFLENNSIVIDGVRFLGCTLWTNFNNWKRSEYKAAFKLNNDHKKITAHNWMTDLDRISFQPDISSSFSDSSGVFHPAVSFLINKYSVNWLTEELNKYFDGKTVIVSHHSPSKLSLNQPNNKHGQNTPYSYVNKLDSLIEDYSDNINLWCHGHLHHSSRYYINNVQIRSNPMGYPFFKKGVKIFKKNPQDYFDENLLIPL